MQYTLSITDVADEEIRRAILAPLVEFNSSQAGPSQSRPIAVLVKDQAGAIVGGLWGHTAYEWLFTQLLVVPEGLRGRGVGTEIMELAEREAVRRGCSGAWLDTFEFQARGFYERLGYECFGELPNYPRGFSRFFMKKVFAEVGDKRQRHQARNDSTMPLRIFVYGTLAPGRPNAHVLSGVPGVWQKASVRGLLVQAGWGAEQGYPGLVIDDAEGQVEGFVLSSDALANEWARLDEFEGSQYERVTTPVRLEDGQIVQAFVYQLKR
jgi:gamma-glutamylcyclotransferase (GGCT)/AIG2-like uncharacterized protein YtfP/GNAT superfamily N-acetyltransferase